MSTRHTLVLPLFRPNLDVTFKGWMGGAIYLENLARVLSLLEPARRPRVLVSTDGAIDTPVVRALFRHDAVDGVFRTDGAPLALKPGLFAEVVTGTQPDAARIDALIGAAAAVFPVFRTVYNPPRALHWIPDFQHKHLPGMFDADELARRDADFSAMAYARKFLLLSSRTAAADLAQFYPGATARVFVWPFASALDPAAAPLVDPRPRYGLPAKYLFAPNQFWKHKDHLTLFRAVAALRTRGVDVTLACTGQASDFRHPAYFAELQSFVVERGLAESIRFLGMVSPDDLLSLTRFAAAVVQPSLFEGWSTVVEDAKAVGRPLILSDLDVHREQGEGLDGFHFFARGNPDDLSNAIARLWPQLAPGPDPAAEHEARVRKTDRDRVSAQGFA
ncbi:MAG: glycosyltransferase, partial [Rhodospirillaceae bacterium]|nr:glycosyltransferase [Rhodospirillaceae bacterium]